MEVEEEVPVLLSLGVSINTCKGIDLVSKARLVSKAFGKKGIPIISHEKVRKRLKRKTKLYGHPQHNYNMVQDKYPDFALPTTVYNSTMKIYVEDEEIQLLNFGPGHTDGDTIVFFKNNNVIHAGDSFVTYGFLLSKNSSGMSFVFLATLSRSTTSTSQ